ncbi:MAG: 50S ribosomal protein L23 [bacterium]
MALFSFGKKQNKGSAEKKAAAPAATGVGLRLLMTEKGTGLQEKNVVTFRVARGVSKNQIARAVRTRYGVVPKKIRTVTMLSKKRRRGNTAGKTAAWKKAYVVVDDMQSFNLGV